MRSRLWNSPVKVRETSSTKRCTARQRRRSPSSRWRSVLLLLGVILGSYYVLEPLRRFLFGNRTMRGGEVGRLMDTLGRTLIFRNTMRKRTERLAELGIQLPPMKDIINKRGIPNLPQAALAELLVRSKVRALQVKEAVERADRWTNGDCGSRSIPNHVLQPDHGAYFRPIHGSELEVIRWDQSSMRQLVQERFPALLEKFDRTLSKTGQTLIWSLCALYSFGGYLFGKNYRSIDKDIDGIVESFTGCNSIAVALFESTNDQSEMTLVAATPRHARLKRMLDALVADTMELTEPHLLELFHVGMERDNTDDLSTGHWEVLTCSASVDSDCHKVGLAVVDKLDGGQQSTSQSPVVYLKVVGSNQARASNGMAMGPAVEVTISESKGTLPPTKIPKVAIHERLSKLHCDAGWICNRCLKNAVFGTHEGCRAVCRPCYEKEICDGSDEIAKKNVTIDVSVREVRLLTPSESRIPRIIHQTWFEEPTVDRYPQLARLQNSWKNTGWEYRFYTDATMRDYIVENFPDRFVDAFDSVIPGAFKADFFRYLVLLKDGGVYADADILLDTNLDSLITPSLSFFVPRDIVGDYAGENFCLWNGLMGAAPGHPFLVRAVEMLLMNILNRVDYHDMERDMCRASGSTGEVWKMRALTILSLSGPCLLGHAVNRAIGRSSFLSKYDPGWLIPDGLNQTGHLDDTGDALILIASRADMGALRFSDVDRNILVASTGMTELSKDRIQTVEEASRVLEVKASHIHYSKFENVNDVFGAEGIYVDRMVNNEVITLKVARVKS